MSVDRQVRSSVTPFSEGVALRATQATHDEGVVRSRSDWR